MSEQKRPESQQFAALVLAADRTGKDPITRHTGAACKAFAPVAGVPMVIRVLDTLAACESINRIILCGPPESLLQHCPELQQRIACGQVTWLSNLDSPSRSADRGLSIIPDDIPVLITTADHALLTPAIVQQFIAASLAATADATVGTVTEQAIVAAFPGVKRTIIRLRDGGFRGCNLYAFRSRGRALVRFWQQAEDLRKKPLKLVARVLGFKTVLSYFFGWLTLRQGVAAVSEKSGVVIQVIVLDDARAGIDVDKVEDLQLAESLLSRQRH